SRAISRKVSARAAPVVYAGGLHRSGRKPALPCPGQLEDGVAASGAGPGQRGQHHEQDRSGRDGRQATEKRIACPAQRLPRDAPSISPVYFLRRRLAAEKDAVDSGERAVEIVGKPIVIGAPHPHDEFVVHRRAPSAVANADALSRCAPPTKGLEGYIRGAYVPPCPGCCPLPRSAHSKPPAGTRTFPAPPRNWA